MFARAVVVVLLVLAVGFVALLQVAAHNDGKVAGLAIARMAGALVAVWVVLGGGAMWALRDRVRARVLAVGLGWRLKFVVFCVVLACLEEAVTVSLTNLAPLFGAPYGQAYITASGNYLDVILFHSVVVFMPLFVALAVILGRYDFSPFAVFLAFGVVGTACEALFAGDPGAFVGLPMWAFVYGLMVWLPAYCLPAAAMRGARPVRWWHHVALGPAILVVALPMILPIVYVIAGVMEHPSIHFAPPPP